MKLTGENPFLKEKVNLLSIDTWKGAALFVIFLSGVALMYKMISPRVESLGGEADTMIAKYLGGGS